MSSLFYVALAMIAGLLLTRVAKLVHLPKVTGYLVAGLLIGPCCLNLIHADALEELNIITTMALGFIAFSIGAEFKLSSIKMIGMKAIVITLFQALSAVLLVDVALCVLGFDVKVALILGAIATATAPAATLMVVRQYKAKGELTNTLLPVVAMDDAVGLVVFAVSTSIVQAMAAGGVPTFSEMVLAPLFDIALSLIIGAAIGFACALAMRFFHSRSSRLCICIAAVLLGVAIAKRFGFSDLLLCMSIGAMIANLRNDEAEVFDAADAWTPPLFMLFFVISGAELNLALLPSVGLLGVAYLVFRSIGKYAGAWLGATVVKASDKIRKYLGITLLPQAGVAIGMAQIAVTALPEYGAKIQAVVLCATLVYELLGPVATKMALAKAGEIQLPDARRGGTPQKSA